MVVQVRCNVIECFARVVMFSVGFNGFHYSAAYRPPFPGKSNKECFHIVIVLIKCITIVNIILLL